MKNLINSTNFRKTLKPLLVLYFVIARKFIRWCIFKPLYKIQCLIDCGKLKRDDISMPVKIKWLGKLNYKLAKLSAFYGL